MLNKLLSAVAVAAAVLTSQGAATAATLNANATANNGGSAGWGIFFDLQTGAENLLLTELSTASSATAGAAFSIEVFTRVGTALGGPVGSGAGSSLAGWTSLGMASATQGATALGISLAVDIPDISLAANSLTGIALVFTGAGPRYANAAALQTFSDGLLTLTTGDARSAPFTPTASFFSPRGMVGSLTYEVSPIPEPGTLAFMAFGLAGLLAWRRSRG